MEKIKGNEGSNASLPVLTASEARAEKKFVELETGRVLVEQAARRAEKEREKLEEERLEKKEKESERTNRDTPEISKQSKWFGVEGKLLKEEQIRWVLEMEKELWDAFQNWKPAPYGELEKQLEELSKLYQALLEAILTCTIGEEQFIQKGRLDEVLVEKLLLLANVRLNNLMGLLGKTDQAETIKRIWYSLYKQTAGENISPKILHQFLAKSQAGVSGGNFGRISRAHDIRETPAGAAAQGRAGTLSGMEEGRVYKLSGRNGIQVSREFIQQRADISQKNGTEVNQSIHRGMGQGIFTGKELEPAEAFAKHIQGSIQLFRGTGASYSAEAAGFLAALLSIKGQFYISDTGRAGAMALPMESLVNRMVDYYLSRKEAYQAYYYTTDLYNKTKDSERAIEKGLEYSYRLFLDRKSGGEKMGEKTDEKAAAFFPAFFGRMEEEEYKKGLRRLKENWREFLEAIGGNGRDMNLRMQRYSPWGAMIEGEKKRKAREEKESRLFKKQVLFLAGLVLLYLGWKFFFS